MKIRLTHKFAELINGIDLSKFHAGDTLDLSPAEAQILMAEGWAEFEGPPAQRDKAHERTAKSGRKSLKTTGTTRPKKR